MKKLQNGSRFRTEKEYYKAALLGPPRLRAGSLHCRISSIILFRKYIRSIDRDTEGCRWERNVDILSPTLTSLASAVCTKLWHQQSDLCNCTELLQITCTVNSIEKAVLCGRIFQRGHSPLSPSLRNASVHHATCIQEVPFKMLHVTIQYFFKSQPYLFRCRITVDQTDYLTRFCIYEI